MFCWPRRPGESTWNARATERPINASLGCSLYSYHLELLSWDLLLYSEVTDTPRSDVFYLYVLKQLGSWIWDSCGFSTQLFQCGVSPCRMRSVSLVEFAFEAYLAFVRKKIVFIVGIVFLSFETNFSVVSTTDQVRSLYERFVLKRDVVPSVFKWNLMWYQF